MINTTLLKELEKLIEDNIRPDYVSVPARE